MVRQQTAAQAIDGSTIGMLRTIFLSEGIAGLYRGVTAPLLAVMPAFAVSFWSYDLATRAIRKIEHIDEKQNLSIGQITAAGASSGVPLATILGPTERIKCLMQVDKYGKYTSSLDCLSKTYQDGGIRSLFRGTGSCVLRDVPGNAVYFGAYEYVKTLSCQLEGRDKVSTLGTLMAGGCAGMANGLVAIPVDTLKSRLQTAPTGDYKNLFDVFHTLVRTEGSIALFRGWAPALLRAFPANAACLCGVETVKGLLEGL